MVGGAFGGKVCLAVIGDGAVRLGVGSLVGGSWSAGPWSAGPWSAGPWSAGPWLAGPWLAGPWWAGPWWAGSWGVMCASRLHSGEDRPKVQRNNHYENRGQWTGPNPNMLALGTTLESVFGSLVRAPPPPVRRHHQITNHSVG
jgi:hypothetical protein